MIEIELLKRIGVAACLGAIIGIERELHHSPAGLRTHTLISLGSALFTVGGQVLAAGNPDVVARIAAQVAVGMGFIGGGIIIKVKEKVTGVTTAADMWAVAAVGLVSGLGYYSIALFSATLILLILICGRWFEHKALHKPEYLER
jgi:putative Mg2+ transporter-C (MgtC) family protein